MLLQQHSRYAVIPGALKRNCAKLKDCSGRAQEFAVRHLFVSNYSEHVWYLQLLQLLLLEQVLQLQLRASAATDTIYDSTRRGREQTAVEWCFRQWLRNG